MNGGACISLFSNRRALVVCENELQRCYVSELLSRLGIRSVSSVASAEAYLAQVLDTSFDLFIVSASMPDMSVLQLIDSLAELRRSGNIIVIGLADARIADAIAQYARQRTYGLVNLVFADEPMRLFDFIDQLYRAVTPASTGAALLAQKSCARISSNDVVRAYRAGEIEGFLQPQYGLANGSLMGAEVLVRWRHPTLGVLGPERFLDLLEQRDLGQELIERLIHVAVRTNLSLKRRRPLKIAVNIPATSIVSASWADIIVQRIRQVGGDTASIVVEVTESGSPVCDAHVAGAVAHWRLHGIDCAIDDFGLGASSLRRLCIAPFNILKVDRQMVWQARTCEHVVLALKMIVRLAHDLGIRVVAEGIETPEDLDRMQMIQCDIGQGYFFSQAVSDTDFHLLACAQTRKEVRG